MQAKARALQPLDHRTGDRAVEAPDEPGERRGRARRPVEEGQIDPLPVILVDHQPQILAAIQRFGRRRRRPEAAGQQSAHAAPAELLDQPAGEGVIGRAKDHGDRQAIALGGDGQQFPIAAMAGVDDSGLVFVAQLIEALRIIRRVTNSMRV